MIAGVFLAAGESRRFGADKLLADLRGKPLVYHSLKPVLESSLPQVYLVRGAHDTTLQTTIDRFFPDETKLVTVLHQHPERGMMSSLKLGLRTVSDSCDGAMILLADMPGLTAELIGTLLQSFNDKDTIVVPACDGAWRHPRIIPKRYFPDFLRLGDDDSGMRVIDKYTEEVTVIDVGRSENYADIDSPGDLDVFS